MVYPDEALRTLMTANDVAFRNRRSLLLLDLQHRVRLEELPWVRAAAAFRDDSDHAQRSARSALVRLGELALDGFSRRSCQTS